MAVAPLMRLISALAEVLGAGRQVGQSAAVCGVVFAADVGLQHDAVGFEELGKELVSLLRLSLG